jgi:hypothetical protein
MEKNSCDETEVISRHLPGDDEKNEQNYRSEQLLNRTDSNPDYLKHKSTALSHRLGRLRELLTSAPNGLSGQLQSDPIA